jgi:alanine racemase
VRNTYAEINITNLENNIKEIIKNYSYDYYFGVVKANCYGHGMDLVKVMDKSGINYFCTATLEEAIEARKYTNKPILCFGYIDLEDIDLVIKNDITMTIISYDYFKELININPKIKVHIKINSGMNRFGIKDKNEVKNIVDKLNKSNTELEGIYTHFATSGVSDHHYDDQVRNFEEITSLINLKDIKIVHLFNSVSTARHKKLPYANGIRFGLLMYGFSYKMNISKLTKLKRKFCYRNISPTMLTNNLNLKKVLSLHSEVVNINKIEKNEFVGYGANYIAKENELIAVISIGHADGITNCYKNVSINHKLYPIVAICMDYIMVKVDTSVKVHDIASLICDELVLGRDIKGDSIHHLLVSISSRVPRKEVE